MRRIFVLSGILAVLFTAASFVAAQTAPSNTEVDNKCFAGEDWEGWCQSAEHETERDWRWKVGYYAYQCEQGFIGYNDIPEEYQRDDINCGQMATADGLNNLCYTTSAEWCNDPNISEWERHFRWNQGYYLYLYDNDMIEWGDIPEMYRPPEPIDEYEEESTSVPVKYDPCKRTSSSITGYSYPAIPGCGCTGSVGSSSIGELISSPSDC